MGAFLLRLSSLVLVLTLRSIGGAGASQEDEHCEVKRCDMSGPIIRFPFRLKDQPDHCGYPGFELSCSQNRTVLEYHHLTNTSSKVLQLPYSIKATVNSIDYESQRISIRRGWNVYPLSSSIQVHSPAAAISGPDFTFFNCSSRTSEGSQNFRVYAIDSTLSTLDVHMIYCTKMHNATILSPDDYASEGSLHLSWSTPVCSNCESKEEYCKLAANSTTASTTTTCFPIPKDQVKIKRLVAGIILSIFSVVLFLASLYYNTRLEKKQKEDQLKIEMFLEDYRALKPTRYSYTDIKKITNQFKDKLGQGGYGSVYKGKLSNDIWWSCRRLPKIKTLL